VLPGKLLEGDRLAGLGTVDQLALVGFVCVHRTMIPMSPAKGSRARAFSREVVAGRSPLSFGIGAHCPHPGHLPEGEGTCCITCAALRKRSVRRNLHLPSPCPLPEGEGRIYAVLVFASAGKGTSCWRP
jgi:hypothetical protein